MAKKVIAKTKSKSKETVKYAKVIRAIQSTKTGAYTFKEQLVPESMVDKIIKA